MTRIIGTVERYKITDRQSWLALRAQDLTASDVGAAAGQDPHKTALRLYSEKIGVLAPDGDNKMMRRGRWLEPAVIAAIREEHGWDIDRPKLYLREPELHLGATPDAIASIGEKGQLFNVQCKVVSRPVYERDWADGPPLPYLLQTLSEGLLLDMPSMIAALVIDTYSAELEMHPVPRHEAAERRVVQIAQEFWADVAAGRPPPADFRRDEETLRDLYPTSVPEPVLDLTGDNRVADLLFERSVQKILVAGCEEKIKAIEVEVKEKLGTHEVASLPGWKVSWKTHNRAEYTVPASTYRALRISEVAEEERP